MNVDRCVFHRNAKLDAGHNFELTGLKRDGRRCPISKTLRRDVDLIGGSGFYVRVTRLGSTLWNTKATAVHNTRSDKCLRGKTVDLTCRPTGMGLGHFAAQP